MRILATLSAVDHSGRIADRTILTTLGWRAGSRLHIREQAGLVVVTQADDGVHRLSDHGFLCLPLTVRRWRRIHTGDRVLLTADPDTRVLVIHPPTVLGALVAHAHHAAVYPDAVEGGALA